MAVLLPEKPKGLLFVKFTMKSRKVAFFHAPVGGFRLTSGWQGIVVSLSRLLYLLTIWLTVTFVLMGNVAPVFADDYNKDFLVGADFSNRVLTDSSFTKANLRGSNFANTDLRGVSFFGANLEGANLEGANLSSATLDTARFSGANLNNAILEGAFAFNAKFDGATVDGADFTDVEVRQDAQLLLCKTAKGVNPTTKRQTRATLGC
jgi:uncharacterized protein YjbI with pentapeptide repeats